MTPKVRLRDVGWLLLFTLGAVAVHGYRWGSQDQAIYLPAIKLGLDPSLYPYDSAFFLSQTRWTLFDEVAAGAARLTPLPLDHDVFLLHLLAVFLILLGCLRLSQRCFPEPATYWAATLAVWAVLSLPVAGTGLEIMARYLQPRSFANPMVLFAFVAVLDGRPACLAWLAAAIFFQPTLTIIGALHLVFQRWRLPRAAAAALVPLGLLLPQADAVWRETLAVRPFLFPLKWAWYEWVGVVAPFAILWWIGRLSERQGFLLAAHISRRILLSSALAVLGAIIISTTPGLELLIPAEPMRALHLAYLLFVLLGGGLIGHFLLKNSPLRWAAFFVPVCVIMAYSQVVEYPATPKVEWPGRPLENDWAEAFDWARRNTPRDALFALDPRHMARPGEDSHGFRALAERSMLADWMKDSAVAMVAPEMASAWKQQVSARERWSDFQLEDFQALKKRFGVTWVVVERPGAAGLDCPYANEAVRVCRIP
jgi:hypothetical protein